MPDVAYISIPSWPEGLDQGACAELYAQATGSDRATCRRAAAHSPPAIIGRRPSELALTQVAALRSRGVRAFAIGFAEVQAGHGVVYAAAIESLRPSPGAGQMLIRTREGLELVVDPAAVRLLVRGQARTNIARPSPGPTFGTLLSTHVDPISGLPIPLPPTDRGEFRTRVYELLDAHLGPGVCVRFAGGELDPGPVLRGGTSRESIDNVSVWLAERSPFARIDTGFQAANSVYAAVQDFIRNSTPAHEADRRAPLAFGVYSAWRACLDRALQAEQAATGSG